MQNRLYWRDRSNVTIAQYVYKALDPIDPDNLPEPIAELPPKVGYYEDNDVLADVTYHYLIGSTNGSVEKFSPPMSVNTGLPLLGPGPQTLIDNNDTAGFFGEVTSANFITGDALAAYLGLTDGESQNSSGNWMKFFIDNQIYYVPKKSLRHTISWDMINAVGAIFDERTIQIGGYTFSIGLLEGLGPDTSGWVRSSYDNPATHGSEWNRLMYNVATPLATNDPRGSQVGDNWVEYPQDNSANGLGISAGNGRYSWTKETTTFDPTYPDFRVLRGNRSVSYVYSYTSSNAGTGYGWRPRLKLLTTGQ